MTAQRHLTVAPPGCREDTMSHRRRIHVPGSTYYTVRRTEPPLDIFRAPSDYNAFEDFLAFALEATGVKLLGYCWMPDTIHLTITIGRRPVAELMRRVTRYCSQHIRVRERIAPSVTIFPVDFPITLVDPDVYLVPLIHYIHYIPVLRGMAATPDEYPYTSHLAYLGERQTLRVHTKRLLATLRHSNLH